MTEQEPQLTPPRFVRIKRPSFEMPVHSQHEDFGLVKPVEQLPHPDTGFIIHEETPREINRRIVPPIRDRASLQNAFYNESGTSYLPSQGDPEEVVFKDTDEDDL
ncbi:hypothetical protein BH09PAT1_BH09PAT1_0430 [soil metagenome]